MLVPRFRRGEAVVSDGNFGTSRDLRELNRHQRFGRRITVPSPGKYKQFAGNYADVFPADGSAGLITHQSALHVDPVFAAYSKVTGSAGNRHFIRSVPPLHQLRCGPGLKDSLAFGLDQLLDTQPGFGRFHFVSFSRILDSESSLASQNFW